MRKIIVHEFITLDGVIQAPGGVDEDTDGGFPYGGWTRPFWDDAIGANIGKAFGEADTLLLGRKTWQTHGEAFEPNPAQDPFGDMQKYVASNTLQSAALWRKSSILRGDVVGQVRRLKEQPGGHILMDGSSVLLHTLIEHDLVDEFLLHVYPLVLGTGKRLFPAGKRVELKLVESSPVATGVVFQRYRKA
jgi:dihydrofolate reductase